MNSARLNRNPQPLRRARRQHVSMSAMAQEKARYLLHPASPDVPYIDQSLLSYLIEQFPVRVSEHCDLRDYDRMVGQQQIIEHLRTLFDNQKE